MTRVLRTRDELRAALAAAPRPIGLVPTMGWLHDGHRSLMARARAENATTVVTIFVNPRQFGDAADFTRYPRNEARDLAICESEGVDLVWAPPVDEVYVPGFDTTVTVGAVAGPLEGAARPGHFDGVATVVAILFSLVGARARLLRPEGRPAGDGHPADGPRPGDRHGGRGLPDGPRAGRPGALVAQRPPARPRSGRRPPSSTGRCVAARDRWAAGERSGDALRARDARRSSARSRSADVDYVSVADADDARRARPGRRTGAPLAGGPLRDDPAHRQRAPGLTRR